MKKAFLSAILMIFLTSCSVVKGKMPATSSTEIPLVNEQISEEIMTIKTTDEVINLTGNAVNHVQVTYVGNSGFMVTTDHKKVLIDGLFRGFEGIYTLPQDIQDQLTLAQPPFDNIDLILVTHSHRDHFSFGLVDQHLQNNPNAILASLPAITSQFSKYGDRIVIFDPTVEEPGFKDINGIQVEAYALSHGPNQPKNIGFVITVDGFTLFFTGDMDTASISYEGFRSYNLPEKNLDIAFIPHFYLTDIPSEQQFVKQGIDAKYIISTHYFYTNPPYDRESVLANYPDAILFKEELSTWVMP